VSERTPIVFVTNLGAHNYQSAKEYGELRFLTRGKIKRYSTNTIYRDFIDGMSDAEPGDYLLVSSLSILNSIAAAILARRFGVVNFLLFSDGEYILRSVNVDALLDEIAELDNTYEGDSDENLRTDREERGLRRDEADAPSDEG
tara:strand:- start:169 stop:600 length:432 start_codon:yes stop_codon:yes gene_type:complete